MPKRNLTMEQAKYYRRQWCDGEMTPVQIATDSGQSRDVIYRMLYNDTYHDPDYTPCKPKGKLRQTDYGRLPNDEAVVTYIRDYMIYHGGMAPSIPEIAEATERNKDTVYTSLKRCVKRGNLIATGDSRTPRRYRIQGKFYPVAKGLFDGLDE